MEEDIEIIKVELSEENLIKPIKFAFHNGSVITVPIDAPEETCRSNNRIIILNQGEDYGED